MRNVFDVLEERGFIDQVTHEEEFRELLGKESITFYIGFDATADSLTLGHFLQIMVMMHMQRAGHKPIALLGGGTTMIGDPSGKTDMRKVMTKEMIDYNASRFKEQLSHFLDFSEGKALILNNADWLLDLNFVKFMREIGVHFSVNRMLTFDCYKNRMEEGLTFFEFGYMLMQSYDFLYQYRNYNCIAQLGGSDQWSNILGGYELIRKLEKGNSYGMTFKLLTTASGTKMGKTEKGAIWLDPNKTPPYEMYQYLRNTDDRDVEKFLGLLTFLPMDEVKRLGALEGAEINKAKEVLAFEVTKLIHGEKEANKAQQAAKALFAGGTEEGSIPTTEIEKSIFDDGIGIIDLLRKTGLIKTNSEGRRLIEQGGITIDDIKVETTDKKITLDDFNEGKILIRKGKKIYHQVKCK
ncbi:tyrosine--tRNA ligase [Paratissierella segnis]|jgi:tyrosyl-tRNA synthetase|uniref:Tyrosine--tRNA ligase n=1 Tax=Paratissierella segnis TaxID=2763679 RepID=A0A926ESW2_9FIRM|nr:tyrosine--tRNA ligase [Paratissierella segnis]MBC8587915.1 tyrosine--tRNA ligase [Paratissierella segnis]